MSKNQPKMALQHYRMVGSVGDKTLVEIAVQCTLGSWQPIGSGQAKRRKGDARDPELALQLSTVRALLEAAKNFATEGERRWPGFFQELL
jgi:hypothetical protein